MSTTRGSAPLSLDDLFNAEVSGSPTHPAESAAVHCRGQDDRADVESAPSPEDPADLEHEDEPDDVDTAAALNLPEADPEDDEEPDEDAGAEEPDAASSRDCQEPDGDAEAGDADDAGSGRDGAEEPAEPTFADLGLPGDLLAAVTDMGFTTPTPIQREAIPVLLSGRDVVGVAQTGTGKTAAFALPLLDAVDASDGAVQALVLAPTRELALQSAEAVTDMAARSRGLDVVAVYGGAPYGPQIGALRAGAQVVVGTPGRVIDLIDKGALDLSQVRYFVLDEADEMLRMGFAEDVETIAASLPAQRRTALFSATMPPAIQKVAREHLTDPVRVEVAPQSSTVDTVHQTYAVVPFRHKIGAASRVLAVTEAEAAIVFVRTKSTAEDVAIELAGRGIQAAAISGDVPQRERERLVERLRAGSLDVLVATDVAARGLDVDRIGLVVNFDVPREAEAYVHRIGRTGRAGRHGEAITFLTPKEKYKLRQIERLTGTELEEVTLPSPADVSAHRARRLLARAEQRRARGRLGLYRDMLAAHVAEQASSAQVADAGASVPGDLTETDGRTGQPGGVTPASEAAAYRDLAATLLALAVGDEGPRRREEREDAGQAHQRERREVEVDEDGTFVAAVFEGGRDKAPRKGRDRIDGKPGASRGGRRFEEGTGTMYRVEVGHRDKVLPGAIVGAIANEAGIDGGEIGRIRILQSFSLVEVRTPLTADQLRILDKATFAGRQLRMRPDEGPGHGWDDGERSARPARRHDRGERRDLEERRDRGEGAQEQGARRDRDERRDWRSHREDRGGRRGDGEREGGRDWRDRRQDRRDQERGDRRERRGWDRDSAQDRDERRGHGAHDQRGWLDDRGARGGRGDRRDGFRDRQGGDRGGWSDRRGRDRDSFRRDGQGGFRRDGQGAFRRDSQGRGRRDDWGGKGFRRGSRGDSPRRSW